MSDLDTLMSKLAVDMTDDDIDKIVAYQRERRGEMETGVRPKRNPSPKGQELPQAIRDRLVKPRPTTPAIRRI
jgi:hypothetical protein